MDTSRMKPADRYSDEIRAGAVGKGGGGALSPFPALGFFWRPFRASPGMTALLLVAFAAGCSGPPERQDPVEFVKDNSSLFRRLGSPDEDIRQDAARSFMSLGPDRGTDTAAWFLENDRTADTSPLLRVMLARILAEWRDPRGIPYLLEALIRRQHQFYGDIESALKNYGENSELVGYLEEQIESPDAAVRRLCASVLAEVQSPAALRILAKRLRSDLDDEVRGLSLVGIMNADPSRERNLSLIDGMTDPDAEIRSLAWVALRRETPPVEFDPRGNDLTRAESIAALRSWAERRGGR